MTQTINETRQARLFQVADNATLRNGFSPDARRERDLCLVAATQALFAFFPAASNADDDTTYIAPNSGLGRWVRVAGPAGLSSGANPLPVGTADPGVAALMSRADHVHAHGNQLGGALHADAGAASGFMTAAEKAKLGTFAAETAYTLKDGSRAFTAPVKGVDPVDAQDLVTKVYADAKYLSGAVLHPHVRFVIEHDVVLPASTYNNGVLGVGATLTADANGTIPDFDGVTPAPNDRLLLEHHSNPEYSGIYVMGPVGAPDVPGPGSPWSITRATDADESAEVAPGILVLIDEGITHQGYLEMMNAFPAIVIGTDPQVFSDFAQANAYIAGAGLVLAGLTFNVAANIDGSIIVNANDVQVGVLATDAQHGARGGGTQHADAIAGGAAGFMSGAQVTKLAGVEALADVTDKENVLAAGGVQWRKKTIVHADLVGAATVEDATLMALLAGDLEADSFFILKIAFSGPGITSCTVSCGITGNETGLVKAKNIFTGVAAGRYGNLVADKGSLKPVVSNGNALASDYQAPVGGTNLLARFTVNAGKTTADLSAGELDYYFAVARAVAA